MKLHRHFYIAAVALYSLLLFLVFRDEILQISRISTSNPGDQRLNFLFMQWGLEWLLGDVYRGAEGFFSLGIFHPYQNALALSSNHLGSLPINLLLNLVTADWFTRGNLWLYCCYLFNGLAAAHCTRAALLDLADGGRPYQVPPATAAWSALAVGVAFAFSMTRVHFVVHSQTLPSFAMPFFFLYGWRALESGRTTHGLLGRS